MILAADIGATNTRLGLFSQNGGSPELVSCRRFLNRDYPTIDAVLDEFSAPSEQISAVSLGVAGLVEHGRAHITNLGWDINSALLSARFARAKISLLNDVEATAYGIAALQSGDLMVLNPGELVAGAPKALIASGTGLGEAIIYTRGGVEFVAASEAGHADFAPADDVQVRLLNYLWRRFTPVGWDRVLSGPGLGYIFEFFRDQVPAKELPQLAARLRTEDGGAVISAAALTGECEQSVAALELFVSIYGAEAGNHALRSLARGGVYLGGGIAPKIASKLAQGTFMNSFCHKDRMGDFLAGIAVYVIMNENTALLGAARYL